MTRRTLNLHQPWEHLLKISCYICYKAFQQMHSRIGHCTVKRKESLISPLLRGCNRTEFMLYKLAFKQNLIMPCRRAVSFSLCHLPSLSSPRSILQYLKQIHVTILRIHNICSISFRSLNILPHLPFYFLLSKS